MAGLQPGDHVVLYPSGLVAVLCSVPSCWPEVVVRLSSLAPGVLAAYEWVPLSDLRGPDGLPVVVAMGGQSGE